MFNQLRTRYRARYGANPYRLASLGYDAVLLAVRIAKDWRLGRRLPGARASRPGGFAGVDGAFRFDRDGVAERSLEVREVTATGTIVVSPAPRGFDELRLPRPAQSAISARMRVEQQHPGGRDAQPLARRRSSQQP